ncbi:hypothetical protein K438DRAFT_1947894 [Mycena galopus ATCC 62051]|nr:hypothetical protein K438DRAFT_1947894 [Mycena galopus ATCC 62051]
MVARFFKVALAPHRAVCRLERCVLRWRDGDPGRVAELDGLTLIKLDCQPTQAPRAQNPLRLLPVVQTISGCQSQLPTCPLASIVAQMISVWIAVCVPFIQSQVQTRNPQRITRMLLSELAKLDSDAQEDSSALCRTRTRGRGEKRD